jgi:hypothetical protein
MTRDLWLELPGMEQLALRPLETPPRDPTPEQAAD